MRKKKNKRQREKRKTSGTCVAQCHTSQDLTMEDRKQTFLHLKIKHKQVREIVNVFRTVLSFEPSCL